MGATAWGGRLGVAPHAGRLQIPTLIDSRRTPVAASMRRSDHPSRPSAITCCCVVSSKTLLMAGNVPLGTSRRATPQLAFVAGFRVSTGGRIWVSTEGGYRVFVESREIFDRTVPTRKPQAVRWLATQPVLSPQEAVRTRP